MTWEQDAAAAIRGLKAENERLREENNVLSAREARAENSALHLGALVDELRARLAGSADLAARLAEAHASLAEGDKRYAAENARLQARLAEAEQDRDKWRERAFNSLRSQEVLRVTDSASVVQYKPCEICTTQSWCETHGCQCYPVSAVQPERCCLDYPLCDCNSPPEPDDEWHCSQYPGCECFTGCREKALEAAP